MQQLPRSLNTQFATDPDGDISPQICRQIYCHFSVSFYAYAYNIIRASVATNTIDDQLYYVTIKIKTHIKVS